MSEMDSARRIVDALAGRADPLGLRYGDVVAADPLAVSVGGAIVWPVRACRCQVGDRVAMITRQGSQWVAVGVVGPTDLCVEGNLDVARDTYHDGDIYLANGGAIYGTDGNGNPRIVLDVLNSNGNTSLGYGGYAVSVGALNIWGNEVNITSRGKINLNGQIRSNKYNATLWTGGSGGYYMTTSHTVTLSENISAQAHGIVLAWSAYSSGTAQNYSWNYTFVPKSHINDHPGAGVSCMLIDPDHIGVKYVYVSNNKITGNDRNDDNGNVSGMNNVKMSNNYWVLRAVYGV